MLDIQRMDGSPLIGPSRSKSCSSDILPVLIAALTPHFQRLLYTVPDRVDVELLSFAKFNDRFRRAVDEVFDGKRLGADGKRLHNPSSDSLEYSKETMKVWSEYCQRAVAKYNPDESVWLSTTTLEVTAELETYKVELSVSNRSKEHFKSIRTKPWGDGYRNQKAGATKVLREVKERMDAMAEDMMFTVFTTKAAYEDWYQMHLAYRSGDSMRQSSFRLSYNLPMPKPPVAEAAMEKHKASMKTINLSMEQPLPDEVGLAPIFAESLQLALLRDHYNERLNIDLSDPTQMNRRIESGLVRIGYADGWDVANESMAVDATWVLDYVRAIWKSGQSGEILGAIWKGTGETAFFKHYERGTAKPTGDAVLKLEFPMFGTWLEIILPSACLCIAGDNKFLCETAGVVSGTGRCRCYYAECLSIRLVRHLKLMKLVSYKDLSEWRVRGLTLIADSVCDLLDDRGAFLDSSEVNELLKEESLDTKGSLTERRARLKLTMKTTWADIEDALSDTDKREKVKTCVTRMFEYVRLHSGITHFPLGAANNPTHFFEMLQCLAKIQSGDTSDDITPDTLTAMKTLLKLDEITCPEGFAFLSRTDASEWQAWCACDLKELSYRGGYSLSGIFPSFKYGVYCI